MSIIVTTPTRTRTVITEVEEPVVVIELDREDALHLGAILYGTEVGPDELRVFHHLPDSIKNAIYQAGTSQLARWESNAGRT